MAGRSHQELRPSQYITTYGPGSILETRSGPVVIPTTEALFQQLRREPQDFEIVDERLSRVALDWARIVRLPTNAELGLDADEVLYPTHPFPLWALCTRHVPQPQVLYHAENGCRQCGPMSPGVRWKKAGREAIRFVTACPEGHLDEVNWYLVAHTGGQRCQGRPDHYLWHGGGHALRFVEIECPRCHARGNFGQAYARRWTCTGRLPERGPGSQPAGCAKDARIFQRGAASLRWPEVLAALTIIDMPGRLHAALSDRRIQGAVITLVQTGQLNQQTFFQIMSALQLPAATLDLLGEFPWSELHDALRQLQARQGAPKPLLQEEFERLARAATDGAPPVPSSQPGAPPLFEVRRSDVLHVNGPGGRVVFRVAPVSRLRMVLVQKGYRRVHPQTASTVDVAFSWSGQSWYPGTELFGEGIFIDLEQTVLAPTGARALQWQQNYAASQVSEARLHPLHVWWHSLSHRLLRALSVDSGYSSAAIRERIYLTFDDAGTAHGGILLYTVQPGGDGTLGGLIALVNRFDEILDLALRDAQSCSNDPLCEEAPNVGAEGSACYACLLVSETSCEHRNLGLDRLLLVQNLP